MKARIPQVCEIGLAVVAALLLTPATLGAQPLETSVSLHYQGEELVYVLRDIERRYRVNFTYSSYHLPVDRPVNLRMGPAPLNTALDSLFYDTDIVYLEVNGHIVLRPDPNKELLTQVDPISFPSDGPLRPMFDPAERRERDKWKREMTVLGDLPVQLPGGDRIAQVDFEALEEALRKAREAMAQPEEPAAPVFSDHEIAQVSLLPFLGTNAGRSDEVTNNFSLNIFWGTNGGVDGVEVGGLVNTVVEDVKGMQVAGLGNAVGGNVTGTQLAGLFNVARDTAVGAQAAGLFNLTKEAEAAQLAGLFNVNRQDFSGLQMAGLFNVSAGEARGVQISGLVNYAGDRTKTQIAGLANRAGDVSGSQISGLLNVGRRVRGAQIGLINVSDSISGPPIGLINIVRQGYNRVEVGGNEALYANLGFKFGAHSFYNIIHFGGRWDALERPAGENRTREGVFMSWGLGYGLGTVVAFSPRSAMNVELVATHINEFEEWTQELNLLNQLRLTFDFRMGQGRSSFFLGPTANLMVSKLSDPESGTIGSQIPPYVHYEKTTGDTNLKFWSGGYMGFRF